MNTNYRDELKLLFEGLESGANRHLSCDLRPIPAQNIPNTRICLLLCHRERTTVPVDIVAKESGTLCNIAHRYRGFESWRMRFEVTSADERISFGSEQAPKWAGEDWLLPPPPVGKLGDRYTFGTQSKEVFPATHVSSASREVLWCRANLPVEMSEKEIRLRIEVSVAP